MRKNNDSGASPFPKRLVGRRVDRGLLSGGRTMSKPKGATVFESEVLLSEPPDVVFDFCLSESGFSSIMPDRITFLGSHGQDQSKGTIYLFRWWMKNIVPFIWVALIDHIEPGRQFSDLQLRGFFRYFHHTHTCMPEGAGTRYRDTIAFASPFGSLIDRKLLLPQLRRTFAHRHRRMSELLGEAAA